MCNKETRSISYVANFEIEPDLRQNVSARVQPLSSPTSRTFRTSLSLCLKRLSVFSRHSNEGNSRTPPCVCILINRCIFFATKALPLCILCRSLLRVCHSPARGLYELQEEQIWARSTLQREVSTSSTWDGGSVEPLVHSQKGAIVTVVESS